MAVRSVQFTTAEMVLDAYESREVPDFTIWADKQYLFKYDKGEMAEGSSYLQQLLEKLQNSAAIYTLKVYEEGHEPIKEKTPADGSFNFRFQDAPVYNTPGHGSMNGVQSLQKKIDDLETRLAEYEGGEGERNENGVMGMVGQILEHPAIMPLIPVLVDKAFKWIDSKTGTPTPGVGSAPQQQQIGALARVSGIDAVGKKRIDQALTILDGQVEDLPAVIEKLAWLAVNRSTQFKMALGMLQGMK